MSKETYTRSKEGLPPLRSDIRHDDGLSTRAIDTLMADHIVAFGGFMSQREANSIRVNARNLLAFHAPLRIGRKVIDKVAPSPDLLPTILKRKPLVLQLAHRAIFSHTAQSVINRIDNINTELYQIPEVKTEYGEQTHALNVATFVRTPPSMWFARHQDSIGQRGFGFALQTEHTLWMISPSETGIDQEDYCFETFPGDVVGIRERAGELPADELTTGTGFETFYTDGSPVHTGLNMNPDQTRYTINLFSVERSEI